MTYMTGSQSEDFTRKIDVLAMTSAGTGEGILTLVLGEQLCCLGCGRVSTHWQIPSAEIPGQRAPVEGARVDPGE